MFQSPLSNLTLVNIKNFEKNISYSLPDLFFYYKKSHTFSNNIQFIFYRKYLFLNHSSYFFKNFFTLKTSLLVNMLKLKKSFKKSLRAKLLQINFFKKYLIILKLKNCNWIFKNKFKNLKMFFNVLLKKSGYLFNSPFFKDPIQLENVFNYSTFNYILFLKTEKFSPYKNKKKSRLKRKITKKLIRKNFIEF